MAKHRRKDEKAKQRKMFKPLRNGKNKPSLEQQTLATINRLMAK
jgi:hypothetical protein